MDGGSLLFGNEPWFPTIWIVGLLGFLAYWWYICRDIQAIRRLFLALWVPAALAAGAVYRLNGQGYAVTETLRLLAGWDPSTLRLLVDAPIDGFTATYAVVVGGAVAALATTALQLAGVLLGAVVAVSPLGRRSGRRR